MRRTTRHMQIVLFSMAVITVTAAAVQFISISRAAAEAHIINVSGLITQSDGTVFDNANVYLSSTTSPGMNYQVLTDEEGRYSVNVAAGQYKPTINRRINGLTSQNNQTHTEMSLVLKTQSFEQSSTFDFVVPTAQLSVKALNVDGSIATDRWTLVRMSGSYADYVASHPELSDNSKLIESYNASANNYTSSDGTAVLPVFDNMPAACSGFSVSVSFADNAEASSCDYSRPDISGDTTITLQAGTPRPPEGLRPEFSTRTAAPQISWTQAPSVNEYRVYRGDTLIGSTSATAYTDISGPQDAVYLYTVRSVSATGQISGSSRSFEMVVDKTPPILSNTSLDKQTIAIDEKFRLSVTAEDPIIGYYNTNFFAANGIVEYYIDTDPGLGNGEPMYGNGVGTYLKTVAGNQVTFDTVVQVNAHLAPGQHTLYVRATDSTAYTATIPYGKAGNWSQPLAITFTVSPPPRPTISTDNDVTSSPPMFSISPLGGNPPYSANIYRNGVKIATTSNSTFTDNSASPGSTYTYTVKALHAQYGYEGPASTELNITYDIQPPMMESATLTPNQFPLGMSTTLQAMINDSLSGISRATYILSHDGVARVMTNQSPSLWTAQFGSDLPAGDYAVVISATDYAGNQMVTSEPITFRVVSPSGSANGREQFVPSASDTLPIERDTSLVPAKAVLAVQNVRMLPGSEGPSGSLELSYTARSTRDEFSFRSTSLSQIVVAQDSSEVSIVGRGTLTVVIDGQRTVIHDVTLVTRINTVGTDHVEVSLFQPGAYSPGAQPAWFVSGVAALGSMLTVSP